MVVPPSTVTTISWGTRLSLALYGLASANSAAASSASRLAQDVGSSILILKQVGGFIRENDSLVSIEAVETLQEIIGQYHNVFQDIESTLGLGHLKDSQPSDQPSSSVEKGWNWSSSTQPEINYLSSYLESLKLTLSALFQTLGYAKIRAVSRDIPSCLVPRKEDAASSDRFLLEAIVTAQQLSLFATARVYNENRENPIPISPGTKLIDLGEEKNEHLTSNINGSREPRASLSSLLRYREDSLATLSNIPLEFQCVNLVRRSLPEYTERLLDRWTRYRELKDQFLAKELEEQEKRDLELLKRRKSQQPTVESDLSDVDEKPTHKPISPLLSPVLSRTAEPAQVTKATPSTTVASAPAKPSPDKRRTLPIPIPDPFNYKPGPEPALAPLPKSWAAPGISQGAEHSASRSKYEPRYSLPQSTSFYTAPAARYVPAPALDPSSISAPTSGSLPFSQEQEGDHEALEIPWRLCLRNHFWDFVDDRLAESNTSSRPDRAFLDRNAWTEISEHWVCKEALHEAKYPFMQAQKTYIDHRGRTKFKAYFSIQQPLSFPEISHLVERTLSLTSHHIQRRPSGSRAHSHSHQRTQNIPIPASSRPLLDRSTTYPPPVLSSSTPQLPPGYVQYLSGSPGDSNIPFDPSKAVEYLDGYESSDRRRRSRRSSRRSSHRSTTTSSSSPEESDRDSEEEQGRRSKKEKSRRGPERERGKRKYSESKHGGKRRVIGELAKIGGIATLLKGLDDAL